MRSSLALHVWASVFALAGCTFVTNFESFQAGTGGGGSASSTGEGAGTASSTGGSGGEGGAVGCENLVLTTPVAGWSYNCNWSPCSTTLTEVPGVLGGMSLEIATDSGGEFVANFPASLNLGTSIAGYDRVGMYITAENPNGPGWQMNSPAIVLGHPMGGSRRYDPMQNLLPTMQSGLMWIELPLSGGSGWTRTDSAGGNFDDLQYVEIHADTWDSLTWKLRIQDITFLCPSE